MPLSEEGPSPGFDHRVSGMAVVAAVAHEELGVGLQDVDQDRAVLFGLWHSGGGGPGPCCLALPDTATSSSNPNEI